MGLWRLCKVAWEGKEITTTWKVASEEGTGRGGEGGRERESAPISRFFSPLAGTSSAPTRRTQASSTPTDGATLEKSLVQFGRQLWTRGYEYCQLSSAPVPLTLFYHVIRLWRQMRWPAPSMYVCLCPGEMQTSILLR